MSTAKWRLSSNRGPEQTAALQYGCVIKRTGRLNIEGPNMQRHTAD